MRAFLVVNCQSALVWLALRSCSQAAISSMRICLLGMRRASAAQFMACIDNLTPGLHRPPTPSLDRGPIQRRVRRAFVGTGRAVLSTSQLLEWAYPRARGTRHDMRHAIRRVCERYCEKVGRDTSIGRPILWRLRNT